MKAAEDATCAISGGCTYSYLQASTPNITDVTNVGDQVTLTGTGFTGTPSTVQVFISGHPQTVTSVTSTAIVFTASIHDGGAEVIEIVTPDGSNYATHSFSFGTPVYSSISP